MADDYLFYDEDYEDISDWDEESDDNDKPETKSQPAPKTQSKPSIVPPDDEEEEKVPPPTSHLKNGSTISPSTPIKTQLTSASNNTIVSAKRSPAHESRPYSPQSISSSFIVHKYSVFTNKEMRQHITSMIGDISSTLNLDSEIVSLLLRRYGWKTERLMENYLSDSVKCLSDNNLHSINPKNDKSLIATNKNTEIECPICVDDVCIADTFCLECNHRFCRGCWTDYINSTINNKSFNSIFMTCPGHKCKTPLKNSIIKQFVDKSQYNKYEQYMVQSYITSNENKYRFCPAPGCHYVIYCADTTPKSLINDDSTKSTISSPSNSKRGAMNGSSQRERARRAAEQRMKSLMKSCNGSSSSSSNSSTSTSASTSKTASPQKTASSATKIEDDLDGFQFFGQSKGAKSSSSGSSKNKTKSLKQGLLHQESNGISIPMKATKSTSYKSTSPNATPSKKKKSTLSPQRIGNGNGRSLCGNHNANFYQCAVFVQCRCGYDLCFSCLEEYHAPATCEQVEEWNLKSLKEADNAQWIVTNTKKCPKCFTRIERNHGCNHMVCTKCQYEFCWVCMGSWKEHGIGTGGYYRCNKYKPKKSMGNKQKLQQSEDEELDKFVHYFNRFHNHAQSRQFLMESGHKVMRKIKAHLNNKKRRSFGELD